jgi:hypothetical protein
MQHPMRGDRLKTQRQVTINCAVAAKTVSSEIFSLFIRISFVKKKELLYKKGKWRMWIFWGLVH